MCLQLNKANFFPAHQSFQCPRASCTPWVSFFIYQWKKHYFFFHMSMEKALIANQSIWGVEYHCPFSLGFFEDSIRLQSGITLTWVLCVAFSCLIRNGKYDSGLASAANKAHMHSYEFAVDDCLQFGRQKEDFINPGAFKPISRRQNWQHYDWYKIILIFHISSACLEPRVLIPHSRSWKVRFSNLQKLPPQFSVKWERQHALHQNGDKRMNALKIMGTTTTQAEEMNQRGRFSFITPLWTSLVHFSCILHLWTDSVLPPTKTTR